MCAHIHREMWKDLALVPPVEKKRDRLAIRSASENILQRTRQGVLRETQRWVSAATNSAAGSQWGNVHMKKYI